MNLSRLLDGLLQSAGAATGQGDIRWGQVGAGAAAGGALGLLLGGRKGLGRKALKYGSVAALGYAAYKVYEQYQARQAQPGATAPGAAGSAAWPASGQPAMPAPQQEWHSQLMLTAMIAAAKADGHVDERERSLIEAELQRQQPDDEERRWLEAELRKPLDPADVARAAVGQAPAVAAEVYLASLVVADDASFMERAYLDELARQLQLPAALKQDLETQARSG
jgi:uncharacterized membrane protein YebE (DUF533 family)